ncbi:hypothetical protein E4U55_006252 [Claviceps digitariae]|nr:hypothetical protein E4U55_006252 [Claviceps digitariae]
MATTIGSLKKTGTLNTSFSSIKTQLQHEPPSPSRHQTTPRTTCRSVKSIVAWLESSSTSPQPWSPSTTAADMPHDLSTSSISTSHHQTRPKERFPAPSDVEDYSLTYLKYRNYFTSAPLGRCLDQTHEDDLHSARGWPTAEATHMSKQHNRDDERALAVVETDQPDETAAMKLTTRAYPGFIQRDPDEVRAF